MNDAWQNVLRQQKLAEQRKADAKVNAIAGTIWTVLATASACYFAYRWQGALCAWTVFALIGAVRSR